MFRYNIEPYKEFCQDIQNIWSDLISNYNFKIVQKGEGKIWLENTKCTIWLLIADDIGQRIYYKFVNPNSMIEYDPVRLFIFQGKPIDMILVGSSEYPETMEEWVEHFSTDDYRGICLIDLPIIRDEILRNWEFILKGNFSFEQDFIKWERWYEEKKGSVNYKQLSFEDYKKDEIK